MRPPYPVDVVPLLPKFLSGKRLPADWIPRAAQELGIDRPAILMALLIERAGDAGLPERSAYSVYTTKLDASAPALAAAQGAGLIAKRGERWHATDAGRDLAARLRGASDEHLGAIAKERGGELARLADLLERAFQASVKAPEPGVKDRLPLGLGFRRAHQASNALAAVDQAVYGLWMFRDDCHIAAWRSKGFDGPTLDVLTRLWREGPATREELVPVLMQQRPEDVDAALERLRHDGHLEPGSLRLTDRGRSDRDAIEAETDRLFFTPWPEDVGAEGAWIRDRLEEAVAAIT